MTVKRFNRAAAEGDGKEACEQLTSAARTPAGGLQCESAIDQLGKLGGEQTKRRLAAVEVRNVKVNGDRATAEAQIPTQTPATLQLEKVSRSGLGGQPRGQTGHVHMVRLVRPDGHDRPLVPSAPEFDGLFLSYGLSYLRRPISLQARGGIELFRGAIERAQTEEEVVRNTAAAAACHVAIARPATA